MTKHHFKSIKEIVRRYPPYDPVDTVLSNVCKSVSELAPPGTRHLTEMGCNVLVGIDSSNKAPTVNVAHDFNGCITFKYWLGSAITTCYTDVAGTSSAHSGSAK